ncbi:MAG: hypothetical protein ACRCY9_18705 [Phycicoccus sp.]
MPDQPPSFARSDDPLSSGRGRRLPAILCGLQAVVLGGLGLVVLGASTAPARVASLGVLALVAAGALAAMARGWAGGSGWQRAPTTVWGLVLVPTGIALSQGGDRVVGGSVVLIAVATVAVAVAAGPTAGPDVGPGSAG